MKKLLIAAALCGFLSIPAQATPLIPASTASQMAVQGDDFIQVKKRARPGPTGGAKAGKSAGEVAACLPVRPRSFAERQG